MPTRAAAVLASGFMWLGLMAVPARAAIDIDGPWNVAITPSFGGNCLVDIVQTGSALTISASACSLLPPFTLTGTIDTGTGAFSVSGAASLCGTLSVNGTANSTSTSFNGTFSCTGGSLQLSGSLVGGLCGNGVVNAGEQCDPGLSPTACCNAQCTATPSGSICLPATPGVCFVGMCDAAGVCQLVPRKGACDDTNPCTEDDHCEGFTCAGTPSPAGAACDLDGTVCTTDTCDGSGTCTAGPCSPCCDAGAGCTPSPATGCKRPASPQATLQLKSGTKPKQSKLKWKWQKGSQTDLAELGDPTAATDYTLCIFEPAPMFSPNPALVVAADAPAGGTCHGQPCWRAVPGIGFAYQDRDRTPGGIDTIGLKAGPTGIARVQVSAKGENLSIAGRGFFVAIPASVQLRASNGTCWESLNGRIKPNGQIDFNHGSPSGAFLD